MWEWVLAKEMQRVISNSKYLTSSRPPGFLPSGWTTYPLLLGEYEKSGHLLEPTALNDWTGLSLRVRKWKAKSTLLLLHCLNHTTSSLLAVNLTGNELRRGIGKEFCGCPENSVSEISSLSPKNQPTVLHHTSTCCVRGLTQLWGAHIFIHAIVPAWHVIPSLNNNTTIHLDQGYPKPFTWILTTNILKTCFFKSMV